MSQAEGGAEVGSAAQRTPVRLLYSALCMDTAFFAAIATLPFFLKREGALFLRDDELGFFLAGLGLSYVLGALFLPRVLRRCEPLSVTRIAALASGGLFAAASFADSVGVAFALLFAGRLALGAYWPPLMAMVGVGASRALAARIARFNSWWGTGKALAFLFCGVLLELFGAPRWALFFASCAMLASVLFLTGSAVREAAARVGEPTSGAKGALPRAHDARFEVALVLLLTGALIGGVWESQFPKGLGQARYANVFGESYDLGINALLFCLYAGQAAAFFTLRAWRPWPSSRRLTHLALGALLAGQALCVFTSSWLGCAAGLIASGLALGVFYSRCLFIAQDGRADASRRCGIHESVLSLGAVLGPPLGGVLAVRSGELTAPFLACVAASGLAAAYALLRSR